MQYQEVFTLMSDAFAKDQADILVPELNCSIHHRQFVSAGAETFLYGANSLRCKDHSIEFSNPVQENQEDPYFLWSVRDALISANRKFRYTLVKPMGKQAKGVILLLHGLNEKRWDKYLPWAEHLAAETGKAVVLFPIAFHMDRAHDAWGNPKLMHLVSQKRLEQDPMNTDSSFVNAAISSRMESYPQRLFWSGMQTYEDLVDFCLQIRKGEIPELDAEGRIDLFGYSIGSFLSLLLMMSDPFQLFSNSRFFCFCGGMTLDRMNPISKYIMDSSAAIALQKSYAQLINLNFETDQHMAHYQDDGRHPRESWFKTMLQYNHFLRKRETRIREISQRIEALLLVQDNVMPVVEALNTLNGGMRDIPVKIEIVDFKHPYSHINPFPLQHKYADEVNQSFLASMNQAAVFFTKE